MLYGALGLAVSWLLVIHPDTRDSFGFKPWGQTPMAWDKALFYTAEAGVAALVIFQASFQIGKWMRGQPINLPKQIFLGSVVALHAFVCFSGLLPAYTLLAFTAIVTIYHDIQYLFIVWFYSNRHYRPSQRGETSSARPACWPRASCSFMARRAACLRAAMEPGLRDQSRRGVRTGHRRRRHDLHGRHDMDSVLCVADHRHPDASLCSRHGHLAPEPRAMCAPAWGWTPPPEVKLHLRRQTCLSTPLSHSTVIREAALSQRFAKIDLLQ